MDKKIAETKFKETVTQDVIYDIPTIKSQIERLQARIDDLNDILARAEKVGIDVASVDSVIGVKSIISPN